MRNKFAGRPQLEGLEQRWVPATIRVVSGSLFVSGQVGALTVAPQATAGQVKITDGAQSVIVSGVGSLISITGTNLANPITFDSSAKAFGGNVLINAGNGNDVLSLTGTIGGNLTVTNGNGDDTFTVTGASKVGGTLNYVGGLGANDFVLAAGLTIGGNLQLTSVNDVTLAANTLAVGAFLSIAQTSSAVGVNLTQTGGSTTVGKNFTVNGLGSANDTINLDGVLTVGGNTSFTLADGTNSVDLSVAAGSFLGGNLTVTGGAGDDTLTPGADLSVGGSTTGNFGEGTNTFDDDAATLYNGNLSLTGGNTTNNFTIDGVVSGGANVTVGNGTNTTTLTSTPAATLRYRGGNGDDILNITPAVASTITVDVLFGTGTAALNLNANLTLNGSVTGTGGAYMFMQNGATLAPTLVFSNFP